MRNAHVGYLEAVTSVLEVLIVRTENHMKDDDVNLPGKCCILLDRFLTHTRGGCRYWTNHEATEIEIYPQECLGTATEPFSLFAFPIIRQPSCKQCLDVNKFLRDLSTVLFRE